MPFAKRKIPILWGKATKFASNLYFTLKYSFDDILRIFLNKKVEEIKIKNKYLFFLFIWQWTPKIINLSHMD